MESATESVRESSEEQSQSQGNTITSPSADYCPDCQYPRWNQPCRNCAEVARQKKSIEDARSHDERADVERMVRRIGGRRFYNDFTVERFSPTDKNKAALHAAVNFSPKSENLFVHGPTGSGKTHLAVIAGRRFRSVDFLRVPDLARYIRSCDGAEAEADALDYWASNPVVILDDLGTSKDTAFTLDLLYNFIDRRYRDGRNGLIVTSNLSLSELSSKLNDDRVSSRLAQMCKIFPLTGEKDWRLTR